MGALPCSPPSLVPFGPPPLHAGAFGLLPFMALWQPPKQPPKVPADKEDLEGVGNLMQKGMESPLVAALCLGGAAACIGQAALAGGAQWSQYFKLLEESRCGVCAGGGGRRCACVCVRGWGCCWSSWQQARQWQQQQRARGPASGQTPLRAHQLRSPMEMLTPRPLP